MREATIEKYKRVDARIGAGATIEQAVKAEQMSTTSYYAAKELLRKQARSAEPKAHAHGSQTVKPKAHKFVDLPVTVTESDGRCYLVVLTIPQLREVLK